MVTAATSIQSGVFYGPITGAVTGNVTGNATGLSGTPNITVGSVTAASGSFSGNVTVGGTLTYQDVTNMDVLGIGTFQQGIKVLANGANGLDCNWLVLHFKTGEIEVVGVELLLVLKLVLLFLSAMVLFLLLHSRRW